jgi:hypothetical protein
MSGKHLPPTKHATAGKPFSSSASDSCEPESQKHQDATIEWVRLIGEDCSKESGDYLQSCRLGSSGE